MVEQNADITALLESLKNSAKGQTPVDNFQNQRIGLRDNLINATRRAPDLSERLNLIAAGQPQAPSGAFGTIGKALVNNPVTKTVLSGMNTLSLPRRAVQASLLELKDAVDSNSKTVASTSDWYSNYTNPEFGGGDLWKGKGWGHRIVGFALDVALDPLTPATLGGTVGPKQLLSAAAKKAAGIELAENVTARAFIGTKYIADADGRNALARAIGKLGGTDDIVRAVASEGRRAVPDEFVKMLGLQDYGIYYFGSRVKVPFSGVAGRMLATNMSKGRLGILRSNTGTYLQNLMTKGGTSGTFNVKDLRIGLSKGTLNNNSRQALALLNADEAERGLRNLAGREGGAYLKNSVGNSPAFRENANSVYEFLDVPEEYWTSIPTHSQREAIKIHNEQIKPWFIDKAKMIPSWLGGDKIVSGLEALQRAVVGNKDAVDEYNSSAETMSVAAKVVAGQKSINDAITGTSLKMIDAARGWGNYTDGFAGTLSGVANKMLDFAEKAVLFSSKISGEKILGGLIAGAEKTSSALGVTIDVLEKFKAKDVYKTLMDTASAGAKKAGDWLIATAATVESFTNEGFVEKVGDSIAGLLEKLKTGLGFGDILAEKAKEFSQPGLKDDNSAADAIQKNADRMKSIRDAMQAGIDSIKGVLDDLRNAAADFAKSLKDTIVGFAGLKGVELPDGFIPKAKSLIENMNSRLNKSMQFASQIQQLQSMNLDAGALKDIIEAGPVKGAQIAASILSGGQTAVNEISSLQKAIEYSGAAIGQMGSEAAYGGLIANAQSQYNRLTEAQMGVTSKGNIVNIAQGAFQVSIDTKGMNDEEQLKAITDKIQETFAILAKELAAK